MHMPPHYSASIEYRVCYKSVAIVIILNKNSSILKRSSTSVQRSKFRHNRLPPPFLSSPTVLRILKKGDYLGENKSGSDSIPWTARARGRYRPVDPVQCGTLVESADINYSNNDMCM